MPFGHAYTQLQEYNIGKGQEGLLKEIRNF